jgi:hypothetical protein
MCAFRFRYIKLKNPEDMITSSLLQPSLNNSDLAAKRLLGRISLVSNIKLVQANYLCPQPFHDDIWWHHSISKAQSIMPFHPFFFRTLPLASSQN